MPVPIVFPNQVAIITGGGRGIGRAICFALAAKGCRVVVVDSGSSKQGKPMTHATPPAVEVAHQINSQSRASMALGLELDAATQADIIIERTLRSFGRVDILINNAAVIHDISFLKMSDDNWDAVYKANLLATFRMTKAVWPVMREQKYGRIINTISAAGLYGNFGQVNYAAMKMGILGFSNSLQLEGSKYNIQVNTISPVAGTRLTETVLPSEWVESLTPELVTPIVLYLCHSSCEESGGIFEMGGGWVGKLRFQRSQGTGFPLNMKDFTPELVADSWEQVCDFSKVTHPTTTQDSFAPIMRNVQHPPTSVLLSGGPKYVFTRVRSLLKERGERLVKTLNATIEWKIGRDQIWYVVLTKGTGEIIEGTDKSLHPDVSISISDKNFSLLSSGKLRPQQALMLGKMKIHGDMKLALKLEPLIELFQHEMTAKL